MYVGGQRSFPKGEHLRGDRPGKAPACQGQTLQLKTLTSVAFTSSVTVGQNKLEYFPTTNYFGWSYICW